MALKPETGPREWSPRWNLVSIHLNAGHTQSGNPKRGWLILNGETGDWVDFVDEGYMGTGALRQAYPDINLGTRLDITTGQYRELIRFAKEQAERHQRGEI